MQNVSKEPLAGKITWMIFMQGCMFSKKNWREFSVLNPVKYTCSVPSIIIWFVWKKLRFFSHPRETNRCQGHQVLLEHSPVHIQQKKQHQWKSLSLEEKRKAPKVDTPHHFFHARPDAYYNNDFFNKPEGLQVIPPSHANGNFGKVTLYMCRLGKAYLALF